MGNLNSRTANEIDYITDDEFLNQDIQLLPNVDDFPRSNKDMCQIYKVNVVFNCARQLLICNGRLNQDKDGNYTYVNVNRESVADYCLSNPDKFKYFMNVL